MQQLYGQHKHQTPKRPWDIDMVAEVHKVDASQLGINTDPTAEMASKAAYLPAKGHSDSAAHVDRGLYAASMSDLVLNHHFIHKFINSG